MSEPKLENWMSEVEKIAAQVCSIEGCFLYDIEFLGSGNSRILRVFIDREGGSTIGDCSSVSKGLNLILDSKDIVPGGEYNLEVSTPGLDRNLKKSWHFEKVVGKKIWVKLNKSLESAGLTQGPMKLAKQLEKELKSIEKNIERKSESTQQEVFTLVFDLDQDVVRIPGTLIEKAKLVIEIPKVGADNKQKKFKKN